MRFRLRTLLIVLAILPPLLAMGWWKYAEWKAEQDRLRAYRELIESLHLPVYPYPSLTVGRQSQKASPDEN
jgi:hypothetical protein